MLKLSKNFKHPALFFSGGVESALLYYFYSNTDIDLTLYVINRRNNPVLKAVSVYNEINKTASYPKKLIIHPIPELKSYEEIPFLYNASVENHDVIIYGGNKFPDDPSIKPINESQYDLVKLAQDPFAYAPFIELDKSEIIKFYYDNGIEHILEITHSCGSNEKVPCKKCFNCKEREWAFNKLEKPVLWGS